MQIRVNELNIDNFVKKVTRPCLYILFEAIVKGGDN